MAASVPRQLKGQEADAGGNQQTADDRGLGVLDRRAELQADRDDHASEQDREQDVRDAGQPGQAGYLGQRVASCPAEHRQGHPVIGEDRVSQADAGRRRE
jgi:hypothetical protein